MNSNIEDKKVVVVIPTHNREKYLEKTLESVLNQTYKNILTVVVDDVSEDNTATLMQQYKDNNIVYIKLGTKASGTASLGRNLGIALTNFDYITFLDSDDTIDPDKIEKQVQCFRTVKADYQKFAFRNAEQMPLEDHEDLDICYTQMKVIRKDQPIQICGSVLDLFYEFYPNIVLPNAHSLSPVHAMSGLFGNRVFENLGGFDNVKREEDSFFKTRLLNFGLNIYLLEEPLYNYHYGTENSKMHQIPNTFDSDESLRNYLRLKTEMRSTVSKNEYIKKFSKPIKINDINIEYIQNAHLLGINAKALLEPETVQYLKEQLEDRSKLK